MSVFETKLLQEQKFEALKELNAIGVQVAQEKRNFTAEEKAKQDKLKTSILECNEKLDTADRLRSIADLQGDGETRVEVKGNRLSHRAPESLITHEDREWAMRAYFINSALNKVPSDKRARVQQALRPEFMAAAEKVGIDMNASDYQFKLSYVPFWKQKMMNEARTFNGQGEGSWAQGSTTYTTGGALVQQSNLLRFLSVSTKYHSGMYQTSRVISTEDGVYNWAPTLDDTANSASVHTELAQMDGLDAAFGHQALPVITYDSATMASIELIEDASLPVEEILESEVIATRIARKENTDYTTASSTLSGLKTAVIASGNVSTGVPTGGTWGYTEFIKGLSVLDWSYVKDESFALQMHQTHYWHMLGLTDNNNRPLINMSMDAIEPRERFLTYPVVINNDLDTFGAGNYSMVAGAFKYSLIRNVRSGLNIRILNERFVYDNLAIGIVGWKRAGYLCVIPNAFVIFRTHS